ncbi:unnamed protein product, partial [Meganyctiphanes norvegica]
LKMAYFNLVVAAVVVVAAVSSVAGQPIILDENLQPIIIVDSQATLDDPWIVDDQGSLVRVRRDSPGYGAPPVHQPSYEPVHKPQSYGKYTPGKVGPVYTFVKTDYHGNFKWGVRHRAGTKYAGSYH